MERRKAGLVSGQAPQVPYIELLRDPRWQRKRNGILERDDYRCRFCWDSKVNLQVHHKRYAASRIPWDVPDSWLITLCERCHKRVTDLRKRAEFLLSEMNLYELPLAIASLEQFWDAKQEPAPDPISVPVHAKKAGPPLQEKYAIAAVVRAAVDRLEIEKNFLIAQAWTREGSRRVDVIDAQIGEMWDRLFVPIEHAEVATS